MMITVMKAKIHHATVTQADVNYEGSITIDAALLEQADILPGERVQVVNLTNGERLETYVITGERGSGVIGMNGPAALKCQAGHRIHIIAYALIDRQEYTGFQTRVVFLDHQNRIARKAAAIY